MFSSSRFMYLCSMSHSICSLISFLEGRNILRNISTSSVCNAALVIRFLIFIIFTMASWKMNTTDFLKTLFLYRILVLAVLPPKTFSQDTNIWAIISSVNFAQVCCSKINSAKRITEFLRVTSHISALVLHMKLHMSCFMITHNINPFIP